MIANLIFSSSVMGEALSVWTPSPSSPYVGTVIGGTLLSLEYDLFALLLGSKVPNDDVLILAAGHDPSGIELQAHHCICMACTMKTENYFEYIAKDFAALLIFFISFSCLFPWGNTFERGDALARVHIPELDHFIEATRCHLGIIKLEASHPI